MTKRTLFEDIQRDPARFYRSPADVLRDRRFDDQERGVILRAWAQAEPVRQSDIAQALEELDGRDINQAAAG